MSSTEHGVYTPASDGTSRRRSRTDLRQDDVVAKFKTKVDEVSEGYLGFFNERIRIEEQYIDQLQKLYVRSRAFDAQHTDDLDGALSTSRLAWREVRDHTAREADTHRALVGGLREAVTRPLHEVRDVQSRIRGRIKEDLKMAEEMYGDMAEHRLPRLKKAYLRKCQEVEDQKRQDAAVALQAKLLADPIKPNANTSPLADESPTQTSFPMFSGPTPAHGYGPPVSAPPAAPASNPALVTAQYDVAHLGPADEKKGRKRSGSGTAQFAQTQAQAKEVFNDLASQGKKQINSFLSRLGGDKDKDKAAGIDRDDTTSPPSVSAPVQGFSHTHSRSVADRPVATSLTTKDVYMPPGAGASGLGKPPSALKGVKLRREMEEADKAYREAVFNLETLRLRREKIQTAANESLEQFAIDLAQTLKSTLTGYVDCLSATYATNVQLTEHAREAIEDIDVDKDLSMHRMKNPRRTVAYPAPVLYDNFYVGPCRSLIFGVSLNDYDYQRGEGGDHGSPPMIVLKCIAEIDRRGLQSEGIYRVSGRQASLQTMMHDIELDETAFQFREKDDVFAIAGILKQYCRQLPEPIFLFPLVERIKHTKDRETHISSNFSVLRAKLSRLPAIHQATLRAIIEHLARVASLSSKNKMDAKNLSVVFGTALFGEDELPKDGDLANFPTGKDTVAMDMIEFAPLLFGRSDIDGPVLPAGVGLSRSGTLQYNSDNQRIGSSHTRTRLPPPESPAPAADLAAVTQKAVTSPKRDTIQLNSSQGSPVDQTPALADTAEDASPPEPAINATEVARTSAHDDKSD